MSEDMLADEKGVREMVERYFDGRAYISLSDVAKLLGVSTKTVKRHVDLEAIRFSRMGHGRKKIRRAFAATDVAAFCLRAAGIEPKGGAFPVRARRGSSPRRVWR